MINCINCEWVFHLYNQCEKANPEIKECENYKKIKREVYKNEDDFYANLNNMDSSNFKL